MACRNFLFDLDGTLTDPAEGITNSLMFAQKKLGMPVSKREDLFIFIGPPLIPMFHSEWGLNDADSERALLAYREYFSGKGIFENEVYPGIVEMLSALRAAGANLYLASSKPEPFCIKILEHFGLLPYFNGVAGSLLNETRTTKGEVIAYALEHYGLEPAETLMVGDRRHDAEGAHANGLECAGVLFGYGGEKELKEAGCCAILASPADLTRYLLSAMGAQSPKKFSL